MVPVKKPLSILAQVSPLSVERRAPPIYVVSGYGPANAPAKIVEPFTINARACCRSAPLVGIHCDCDFWGKEIRSKNNAKHKSFKVEPENCFRMNVMVFSSKSLSLNCLGQTGYGDFLKWKQFCWSKMNFQGGVYKDEKLLPRSEMTINLRTI